MTSTTNYKICIVKDEPFDEDVKGFSVWRRSVALLPIVLGEQRECL
jgi:hypothetical protein